MKAKKLEVLPPLPPGTWGKPKGERYKEQYGVIVVCPDEATQKAVFDGLRSLTSCKLKVVVT